MKDKKLRRFKLILLLSLDALSLRRFAILVDDHKIL